MAQQVIPTAQLIPRFHIIGRYNNYAMLQSIPCSPECKIVGQILLDHLLIYALTATADVPVVYLQQLWRTVSKVPDLDDTIKFMLNTQEFNYIVDMFRDILHLPVETPENPFVALVNIETIEAFTNRVFNHCLTTRTSGHDRITINILQMFRAVINRTNVDYAALLWIKEDYHSIKDDIPLVRFYTTGNVLVRGMLIPNAFLTKEIRATDDSKEYETMFMNVDVLVNQPVITRNFHQSTPGNISSDFLENSKNDEILPVFSPFYNNPYLKDMQAFHAKESPISPPDPITPPIILTPSTIYELGKSFIKMCVKHHEEQIESTLNYLEELSFHYIKKMKEGLVNGWIIIPRDFDEVKTKLKEAHTQILKLPKKHMGQRDKIAFVHFRISDLEMTLEDIQDRHQLYVKNLMGHTS
uniref:Uncharacterized protein n=1 Tax=Tanacetum cinerariifolium TaxID=118510 RepID=A0A6L2MA93_TANCI|nr:hypothetical protein [Tanacetum cinerariifolium]